jgi:hypothetical protein
LIHFSVSVPELVEFDGGKDVRIALTDSSESPLIFLVEASQSDVSDSLIEFITLSNSKDFCLGVSDLGVATSRSEKLLINVV